MTLNELHAIEIYSSTYDLVSFEIVVSRTNRIVHVYRIYILK